MIRHHNSAQCVTELKICVQVREKKRKMVIEIKVLVSILIRLSLKNDVINNILFCTKTLDTFVEKEDPSLLSVTLKNGKSNSLIASFSQPIQVCIYVSYLLIMLCYVKWNNWHQNIAAFPNGTLCLMFFITNVQAFFYNAQNIKKLTLRDIDWLTEEEYSYLSLALSFRNIKFKYLSSHR